MTVKELKQALEKFDDNLSVTVPDEWGFYRDVKNLKKMQKRIYKKGCFSDEICNRTVLGKKEILVLK